MARRNNGITAPRAAQVANYSKVSQNAGSNQARGGADTQGGAYVILTTDDLVVSNDSIAAPMWSNNNPTLNVFYTSSTQVSSNVAEYYTSIFQTASTEVSAEIQFDIAYGDLVGSGSQFLNNLVTGSTPTRTTYGQYRNLVLGDENASFIFSGVTSSYWYAMPMERARYKQSILPGTWTLNLQGYSSNPINNVAITTNLIVASGSIAVTTANYPTIANTEVEFLYADGSAVAVGTNDPSYTGTTTINVTAGVVDSITFNAGGGVGTAIPTNIQSGMIFKVLGTSVGGTTPDQDLYLRVNENFMTATSTVRLTDDSKINTTTQFCDAGRIFQIISGSAGVLTPDFKNVNGYSSNSGSYGFLLPDINTLILNGEALDTNPELGGINFGTSRSFDSKGENSLKLVDALNRDSRGFTINSQEDLSSDYIFCRAKNSEYNYSANPSFISSSTGAVLFPEFINNPTTYITTVGLYNISQELLAVAKLSRPLEKNFTKELLVRVKLDF